MTGIPRSALILGLAGLVPFLWGAATVVSPRLSAFGLAASGPRFVGSALLVAYGTVILAFMSGVIWGFAAQAEAQKARLAYGLSVLPALWAFVLVGGPAGTSLLALTVGFAGLLLIDALLARQGLAPGWWMPLRILLTSVVLATLLTGLLA